MTENLKSERAKSNRLINEISKANPRGDFSRGAIKRYGELLDRINEIDVILSARRPRVNLEIDLETLFLIDTIQLGKREVKIVES